MEIRDIDYMLAVAEYRGFSSAANALHISQPALSRYIANLEKRLGVQLFQRTAKQLMLTYAGERYQAHAEVIKSQTRELEAEIQRIASTQRNRINIGVIRSDRQLMLSKSIETFNKRYPEITLHISELLSRDLEAGVLSGTYDIAFLSEPIRPQGLEFRHMENNFILLMLPKGHLKSEFSEKRAGLPFPWIDVCLFGRENLVLQDERCRVRLDLDKFFLHEGFHPKIKMLTQSTIDAIHFAEDGIGITFLPDCYRQYITDESKVELFCVGNPVESSNFGVISRKGNTLSPPMEDFIEIYMQSNKTH